jgi:hypothetical protein
VRKKLLKKYYKLPVNATVIFLILDGRSPAKNQKNERRENKKQRTNEVNQRSGRKESFLSAKLCKKMCLYAINEWITNSY